MQRSPMETTEYLEIELLYLIIKLRLVPLQPAGLFSTLYNHDCSNVSSKNTAFFRRKEVSLSKFDSVNLLITLTCHNSGISSSNVSNLYTTEW